MVVANLSMSKNPFALLGLEPCYRLDLQDLEHRYLKIQSAIHPDRFIHNSEMEKSLALKQSADLNQAYQTLKCPLKRAAALLTVHQIPVPGQNGQTLHNPKLLMEVMEWQETILEADSTEALGSLKTRLEMRIDRVSKALDQAAPHELASLYSELSYLLKLQEEIKHKGF